MTSLAALISLRPNPVPPTTLKTIRLASLIGKSRRGLLMAATAASAALVFPCPVPTPMSAVPASFMTARTSAKSTLTNPVLIIISLIPTTPCRSISSATKNASVTGVLSGTILKSLSLLTTINVSTCFLSCSIAASACFIRFRPSKAKGLVTTPTVRQPQSSLEISATMGAAPLPVPPPMPAVMNTISAPEHMCLISFPFSSAEDSPTEGIPPAPRPRVTSRPMLRRLGAKDFARACASVFMAQKETPSILVCIILFTALPPPPPTPSTLITQGLPRPPSGIMIPLSNIPGDILSSSLSSSIESVSLTLPLVL
mmetsp:Transcript_3463/g.4823  ORF Transcript_3463/g.4823 Transcript_3463/m.4823 type:complete len:313 (-) Transcript_3463:420-1358(-)